MGMVGGGTEKMLVGLMMVGLIGWIPCRHEALKFAGMFVS